MELKELKEWFSGNGYYIGCVGCDIEIKEGIIKEYDCKQEDMLNKLFNFIDTGEDDIEERTFYVFSNIFEFNKWCKEGDWKDSNHFEESTGVSFNEIKGKFFQVIHGRIFVNKEKK